MIVGLTGGIGSGKSTVLKMFQQFAIATYIADVEAKKLMNSSEIIRTKLVVEFGEEVYENNQLNRSYLANIVFSSKEKLAILNTIVHPEVHKHLQEFIQLHQDREYILYENAILFENGSDKLCDKIITVTAPKNVRIQRVVARDNLLEVAIKNRMKNQWSDAKKIIQSNYIIYNTSLEDTERQILKIHNNLTKKSL